MTDLPEVQPDPNRVLVLVDFSEPSREALIYAAKLAKDIGGPLQVLHVIHDPTDSPGYYSQTGTKTLSRLEDAAAKMMDEFLESTDSGRADDVIETAETILLIGTPVTRILEYAAKLEPRMVVVADRGRTSLGRLVLGSKAEQVVRHCSVPVLVVRS